MRTAEVKNLTPTERLLYFINEREAVRRRRLAKKPKPWTDDEILQSYRFTNVRRMDDKVSQWFLKNWYEPNFDHPNMYLAVTLARQFNNPEAMAEIGFPRLWNPKLVEEILLARARMGLKNFNAAYMITGTLGGNKVHQVVWKVANALTMGGLSVDSSSMAKTWEEFLPYKGFSSFMAGQVTADLRWAMTGKWEDKHTWAPMGPGSKRGLNRFMGREADANLTKKEFNRDFIKLLEVCHKKVPYEVAHRLEAIDYQSCLCEFDKYSRALLGQGRPKQLYKGVP